MAIRARGIFLMLHPDKRNAPDFVHGDKARRAVKRVGFFGVVRQQFHLVDRFVSFHHRSKEPGADPLPLVFRMYDQVLDEDDRHPVPDSADDADQALRFDHTVPLARYVAEHESALAFPFRVTQIGRNFRGERAQKGRFRDFYQLDVDIVGRNSLFIENDAEVILTLADASCNIFVLWSFHILKDFSHLQRAN